jgi:hypothetical protein
MKNVDGAPKGNRTPASELRGRLSSQLGFSIATLLVLVGVEGFIPTITTVIYSRIIMRTPLLAAILSMIADTISSRRLPSE